MFKEKQISPPDQDMIGKIFKPAVDGQAIAVKQTNQGSFFTKLHVQRGTACCNTNYIDGLGLVCFVTRRPEKGEVIAITRVNTKSVVGQLLREA